MQFKAVLQTFYLEVCYFVIVNLFPDGKNNLIYHNNRIQITLLNLSMRLLLLQCRLFLVGGVWLVHKHLPAQHQAQECNLKHPVYTYCVQLHKLSFSALTAMVKLRQAILGLGKGYNTNTCKILTSTLCHLLFILQSLYSSVFDHAAYIGKYIGLLCIWIYLVIDFRPGVCSLSPSQFLKHLSNLENNFHRKFYPNQAYRTSFLESSGHGIMLK